MNFKLSKIAALGLVIVSLELQGCASLCVLCQYHDVTEPPKKQGNNTPFQPQVSSIQPGLLVPYSTLSRVANQATDGIAFNASGSESIWHEKVTFLGLTLFEGSVDANWSVNAHKNGSITVGRAINNLRVTVPVAFGGNVGLGGDLAKLLSLSGKSFGGAFHVDVATGLVPDGQFCPRFAGATANLVWDQGAQLEVIGRNCIGVGHGLDACAGPVNWDLTSKVNGPMQSQLNAEIAQLNNVAPCQDVHEALEKAWKVYSFPLKLENYGEAYVNVVPKAIYVPAMTVDDLGAHLAARLDATVSVDPTAVDQSKLPPFPSNQNLPVSPGRFDISVPVSAKYETLQQVARDEFVGHRYDGDTPAGHVSVTVKSVSVYPSDDRLAIGVGFVLHTPSRLFNSSGKAWFVGHLVSDPTGRHLQVRDIHVTRKFDNTIWDIASVLLQGEVEKAVSPGIDVDLGKNLDGVKAQILAGLKKAPIELDAQDVSVKLGRIYTGDTALTVEGLFDATILATLGNL